MARVRKSKPITRSFHCPECEKKNTPKFDDLFVTIGSTGSVKLHKYEGGGVLGITPHIIICEQYRNTAMLLVTCAIDGCGIEVFHNEDFTEVEFDVLTARKVKMTAADWKALQNFKEKEDYYI